MTIQLRVAVILVAGIATSSIAWGQEPAAKGIGERLERVAYTQPPEGDLDYELLGEFVGLVNVGDKPAEPLGLQLRPVGLGNFEALQFIGGLPGQEGVQSQVLPLLGRRFEDYLVLSGGPWVIVVEADACRLSDRHGNSIGRLERIRRGSPTMGALPPTGAVVLFDGTNTAQFVRARMTDDGLLMPGADVLPMFQDFNLHVEFMVPYMPNSTDQARGNSGCYLLSRYEVQILDSFGELPTFNGASSLYRTKPPDVNMSFPPLVWQTYDIKFTSPRWGADGAKLQSARITVWHNGVKTQDNFEVPNKTGAGQEEAPTLLPIRFQDHRDPVLFRNIWIVDRGLVDFSPFPVLSPTPEELAAVAAAKAQAAAQKLEQEQAAQAAATSDSAPVTDTADSVIGETQPSEAN
ncbi:MAG: DUF1080 domain-containing protein [Pirellulaceae bacterium]|nr:DUF1080 domain-containing protein [Pirellulaceae bacterium]